MKTYQMVVIYEPQFYGYIFFLFRWPAMCIHGDKSQQERDWVLSGEYICGKLR